MKIDADSQLVINICPEHKFFCVSIDGQGGGTRVTPGKCCGRWQVLKAWKLSKEQWQEIETLAAQAQEGA